MITDGKKWHYLAVKSVSALFRGITSKHDGDFYCLNCFQAYTSKDKLKKHASICENHGYCYLKMPEGNINNNKIQQNIKIQSREKYMRAPFFIYADLESLSEKMITCRNDPEKSSTTKISKHTPSGYSLFICCSFDTKENSLDCYRYRDCRKKFCKDLKEHVTKIINYETKKIIPLTSEGRKAHRWAKKCHISKGEFSADDGDKKYHKVRDHCHYTEKYRGAAHNIFNLRYRTPREISVVFHNGSVYDNHLIIKDLPKEFEGQFECLGENTEKYITFSVPIKKQLDNGGSVTYKIKFIDSYRFMPSPLSILVDNLSEGLHSKHCTDCKSYLDYISIKDNLLIFRCFECKKI